MKTVGTLTYCWWNRELAPAILESNLELWSKSSKAVYPFNPAISLPYLFAKVIREKGKDPICPKIFTAALLVVAKNWRLRGCSSIRERLNKLWYMIVWEYCYAIRNDEQVDSRESWKDLLEIMKSEMIRTKRMLHKVTVILLEELL